VCEGAFVQVRDELDTFLWECGSGRELREKVFGVDIQHAAHLNVYETVPQMRDGYLMPIRIMPELEK
jgi:2-phosphosulfolactate phosphatase